MYSHASLSPCITFFSRRFNGFAKEADGNVRTGILAYICKGTSAISGKIDVSERGFRGGTTGSSTDLAEDAMHFRGELVGGQKGGDAGGQEGHDHAGAHGRAEDPFIVGPRERVAQGRLRCAVGG